MSGPEAEGLEAVRARLRSDGRALRPGRGRGARRRAARQAARPRQGNLRRDRLLQYHLRAHHRGRCLSLALLLLRERIRRRLRAAGHRHGAPPALASGHGGGDARPPRRGRRHDARMPAHHAQARRRQGRRHGLRAALRGRVRGLHLPCGRGGAWALAGLAHAGLAWAQRLQPDPPAGAPRALRDLHAAHGGGGRAGRLHAHGARGTVPSSSRSPMRLRLPPPTAPCAPRPI